jgi:hypothetical protein
MSRVSSLEARVGRGAGRREDGVKFYDAEGREIFGGRRAGATPEADKALSQPFRFSRPVVTASEVIDDVAGAFDLSRAELLFNRRLARLAQARMAGYWLIRDTLKRSYPEIARALRRADHTTILHGCRETNRRLANGGAFATKVLALRGAITARKQALAEAASAEDAWNPEDPPSITDQTHVAFLDGRWPVYVTESEKKAPRGGGAK